MAGLDESGKISYSLSNRDVALYIQVCDSLLSDSLGTHIWDGLLEPQEETAQHISGFSFMELRCNCIYSVAAPTFTDVTSLIATMHIR